MTQPPLDERFRDAQARVQTLPTRPDNLTLLELYALFKQAAVGDVEGDRPGMMDFKGRAKYDAWAQRRGMTRDAAMQAYVALVDRLAGG